MCNKRLLESPKLKRKEFKKEGEEIKGKIKDQGWVAFMSQPNHIEVKVGVELRLILKLELI